MELRNGDIGNVSAKEQNGAVNIGNGETARNSNRFDYIFKIVVVGDASCGKTSLISRFVDDTFATQTLSTIGVDFRVRTVTVDGVVVKLQIWDTAGQERFATIGEMYYRGSHGCVLVYDITNSQSFKNLPKWMHRIENKAEALEKIVVGCKCDLEEKRQVSIESGQVAAIEAGSRWIETSSKSGDNIDKMFQDLTSAILARKTSGMKGSQSRGSSIASHTGVSDDISSVTLSDPGKEKRERETCWTSTTRRQRQLRNILKRQNSVHLNLE